VADRSYTVSSNLDFVLSADQRMLRDSAAHFLATESSAAAVRAAIVSPQGHDAALWARMAVELGWCALPVDERHGGLGMGWTELTLLLEQMGRRLLCAPYFATVCLAATVLREAANDAASAAWLPRIAAGELSATLAFGATGIAWRAGAVTARARATESGYVIDGDWRHVPDGAQAQLLVVTARLSDTDANEIALFAVPADKAGITRRAHEGIDLTRRVAAVAFENVAVDASALITQGAMAEDALRRTEALAAIALAAEQLGGAQQCLDLTLAYTTERVQFGRSIASFQAVKHRCAEMMVRIEATRSAVHGAARAVGAAQPIATGDLALEAACAKTFASETFFWCAQEAIQLHGGVGFTWDYDPQLYFKRAQASTHWLGDPDTLRERAAAALLG
jgi:alkylation response protein AidB-like acyl-CoA dehydrogenase